MSTSAPFCRLPPAPVQMGVGKGIGLPEIWQGLALEDELSMGGYAANVRRHRRGVRCAVCGGYLAWGCSSGAGTDALASLPQYRSPSSLLRGAVSLDPLLMSTPAEYRPSAAVVAQAAGVPRILPRPRPRPRLRASSRCQDHPGKSTHIFLDIQGILTSSQGLNVEHAHANHECSDTSAVGVTHHHGRSSTSSNSLPRRSSPP
ncbi:hypothetical protein EVG20_g7203 [Dentipellis fragilis]|uniref:Uncharacterized protein n=1 Tax=Dentipellis fragilis TaxID=205917 RepID=A0A4Y9YHV6_9AGAM|nr:hypothetical protein EVG20_g7203 [Dentipellis fragilis]